MSLSRKWQGAPPMFSALFLAAGALQTWSRLAAAYELPCRTSYEVHASQISQLTWFRGPVTHAGIYPPSSNNGAIDPVAMQCPCWG